MTKKRQCVQFSFKQAGNGKCYGRGFFGVKSFTFGIENQFAILMNHFGVWCLRYVFRLSFRRIPTRRKREAYRIHTNTHTMFFFQNTKVVSSPKNSRFGNHINSNPPPCLKLIIGSQKRTRGVVAAFGQIWGLVTQNSLGTSTHRHRGGDL